MTEPSQLGVTLGQLFSGPDVTEFPTSEAIDKFLAAPPVGRPLTFRR